MESFIRFFKKTTVRVALLLIFVALLASAYFFRGFYKTQIKNIVSCYWVWRGDKYYKQKKPQDAIVAYKKGIELNPKHYKAKYNLANIFVVYEDYYSAIDYYEKTLEIKPAFQIARINYGLVLANGTFNYDAAIREYEQAIKLTPKWVYIPFIINNKNTFKHNQGVAYYNLGLAWRGKSLLVGERNFNSREYLENAVGAYKEALKISKNYNTYYNLALANQLLNNHLDAGKTYCKAIEIAPMNYEAHYNLAILLMNMKRYKESIDEFKKAGLILDVHGDGIKSRFIYNILNDTVQKMIQGEDYNYLVEQINAENEALNGEIAYINGKVVVADELDRAMVKNFKTCSSKKFFDRLEHGESEDLRQKN